MTPRTAPRTRRLARRAGYGALLVVTTIFAVAVAGLVVAGSHQATLASAIRPGGDPRPPASVLGSPVWTLSTSSVREWSGVEIAVPEVPVAISGADKAGGGPRPATTATVHLTADSLEFDAGDGGRADGKTVVARGGSVSLEFGSQELGTPFGLCAAHLTAFENGSLVGGAEPRARIGGRILRPELAGDPAAATTAGACGDEDAAFEVGLRSGEGSASAVINGVDRSLAGRGQSSADDGQGVPGSPSSLVGRGVGFGSRSIPLGLPPTGIEARAHTIVVSARFDEVEFAPADLAASLAVALDGTNASGGDGTGAGDTGGDHG